MYYHQLRQVTLYTTLFRQNCPLCDVMCVMLVCRVMLGQVVTTMSLFYGIPYFIVRFSSSSVVLCTSFSPSTSISCCSLKKLITVVLILTFYARKLFTLIKVKFNTFSPVSINVENCNVRESYI